MKILVTGGAGYIGSAMVEALVERGHAPVVFDNLSMGHAEAVHPGAAFVRGDLADVPTLRACLETHEPEACMHFASHTMVGESMERPFLYLGDNVRCAANLLEELDRIGCRRFILSSTANLFDAPERIPIGPDERIVPGSPYGESKAIIERMLHWLGVTRGWRCAALRYFNAAGATPTRGEDHTPETHIIPLVLQVALGQREGFTVFGDDFATPDGSCVRDYVHISDLARAHIAALDRLAGGADSFAVNLGNGRGFSNLALVQAAREITGHAIPAEIGARRAGDPATLVADASQARELLGWSPEIPDIREIIETAWRWHRAHPSGYAAGSSHPISPRRPAL